jgi:hypothetical protein
MDSPSYPQPAGRCRAGRLLVARRAAGPGSDGPRLSAGGARGPEPAARDLRAGGEDTAPGRDACGAWGRESRFRRDRTAGRNARHGDCDAAARVRVADRPELAGCAFLTAQHGSEAGTQAGAEAPADAEADPEARAQADPGAEPDSDSDPDPDSDSDSDASSHTDAGAVARAGGWPAAESYACPDTDARAEADAPTQAADPVRADEPCPDCTTGNRHAASLDAVADRAAIGRDRAAARLG